MPSATFLPELNPSILSFNELHGQLRICETLEPFTRTSILSIDMVGPRVLRPAARLFSSILPIAVPRTSLACSRPAFTHRTLVPSISNRRSYATPSGVKEVAVRDALNEALAEELESNDKVFVLGEEVAQYNGAYVQD